MTIEEGVLVFGAGFAVVDVVAVVSKH